MAEVFLGDELKVPPTLLKRKRQLRRLNDEPTEGNVRKRYRRSFEKEKIQKIQRCSKRCLVICSMIAILIVIAIGNYVSKQDISASITNVMSNYWRNYHQIVHGKNYCDEEQKVEELAAKIRNEEIILHQSDALMKLQSALKYDRNLISIALVGPVGVGKTLYANTFQKYFPWPQNVQSYVWNIFVRAETEKYRSLYMLLENFSNCGVNLLIVKNLNPTDKQLVEKIVEIIQHDHNLRQKRIILLFIFHLNTMLDDAEYSAQQKSLQNLKYTTSINFKPFGKEELKDCIKRALKSENVTISHSDFKELINAIDVKRSGCENVNSKVLAFAYQAKSNGNKED